ncbi:hypothetical protein OG413_29730 [Streptomyces sp. NBC_01433]|uniref:hypothetical protein n=1 Tax=Streptomyces sp. NBC_01433 TaxID=2903864 RepID=UPI0022569C0F|nr:hypothetical protein [Streptomyces sp. NBC_01433]MCX4679419.1 hypothetical protein [Streptomyces sp. NBC_01433]
MGTQSESTSSATSDADHRRTPNGFWLKYPRSTATPNTSFKAHVQHVLTAIAVNIERLSGLPPDEETPAPRRPTAFQDYLDQREMPRLKSWRILGS